MKKEQKIAIFKSLVVVGFTIFCFTFIGKYAYPVIIGTRIVGNILFK